MDPELDMDEIYLMARGIMVQLNERVENSVNLALLQRFQRTLRWLDTQARQREGHPGTKQSIITWLDAIERQIARTKGEAKLELKDIDVEDIKKFYKEQGW